MKFIHCADLHIDSPLRKLSSYSDSPADKIKSATRSAFEKIIDYCLEEEADFLLISGDLFDGNCRDFNTILWICKQARRLGELPILIVHGNHDYANGLARLIPWPKNVHLFSSDHPSTKRILSKDGIEVAVHGQSYPKAAVKENLAIGFPEALDGAVNIGILHCNFEGSADHDPYAPCKRADLVSKSYDYWALGHIHQSICYAPNRTGEPWIVYPGNIQGRHIRESGPKGCFLVSANQDGICAEPKFLHTDTLRWYELMLPINPLHTTMDELIADLEMKLEQLCERENKHTMALRIHLSGKTKLYQHLLTEWPSAELRIRDLCSHYQNIWIEKIKTTLKPSYELKDLSQNPFLSKVIEDFELLAESGEHQSILDSLAKEVEKATGELVHKSNWDEQGSIEQILHKSKEYLLSKLTDGGFLEN